MPRVNFRCIASSPRFPLSLVGPGLRLGLLRGIIKRNCTLACCMFCAGSGVAAVSRKDTAPSLRESQTGGTGRYNTVREAPALKPWGAGKDSPPSPGVGGGVLGDFAAHVILLFPSPASSLTEIP